MQSKRPATLGRRSGTTLLGPSTLLPANVRHQSSCANDSTVNPQSLQRLQDLPVCKRRLIICDWLCFRTLSSHSLLAFSHVHASSNTLRTCHHGKRCKITTLNVGRISQLDTTGPFWALVGRTVGLSFSQAIHIATTCLPCPYIIHPTTYPFHIQYRLPGSWVCGSTPWLSILLVCLR